MKQLLLIVGTYSIVVLHTGLARDLEISGIAPHLILAGLVVMTAHVSRAQGILLAALCGLLADCLAEGRLGPNLISYLIATAILQRLANQRGSRVPWKLSASSTPLIWGILLGGQLLSSFAERRTIAVAALAINAAGTALYTGLVVAVGAYAIRLLAPDSADRSAPAAPTVSNTWRMLTE